MQRAVQTSMQKPDIQPPPSCTGNWARQAPLRSIEKLPITAFRDDSRQNRPVYTGERAMLKQRSIGTEGRAASAG
jgi:hypothetical protein